MIKKGSLEDNLAILGHFSCIIIAISKSHISLHVYKYVKQYLNDWRLITEKKYQAKLDVLGFPYRVKRS